MTLATLRWCWGSELWSAIREANTPSLWSLVVKQSLKNWETARLNPGRHPQADRVE